MNSLQHLPEDIRSEFSVNGDGQAFATRRAIARLAGVSHSSIVRLLESLCGAPNVPEIFESFIDFFLIAVHRAYHDLRVEK